MLPLRHDIGRVTFIVLHDFIFVRGRKYHKKIVDVNVSLLLKQKTPASANADMMILASPGQHSCNTRTHIPTTFGQAFLYYPDIHS